VPPPHYYEGSIRVRADGQGVVALAPDYGMHDTPHWAERFTVPVGALERLRAALLACRPLLAQATRQPTDDRHLGGPTQMLTVRFDNEWFTVSRRAAAAHPDLLALFDQVRRLAPTDLWEALQVRRAAYWNQNTNE